MGKNFYQMIKDGLVVDGGGGTPAPVLIEKSITANGEYSASDDSADGYSSVNVAVANSYTAQDEGKVVSNGALVSQTSDMTTQNGTVDTTIISSLTVNVPNTYTSADEGKVVSNSALVSQSSSSTSSNGTVDTTLINSLSVSVPTYSAADNGKVIQNGELTAQSTNKSITANGTGIDTTYYSSVDVAVANSYSAGDEGKVVQSGALVSQTNRTLTANGAYNTTTNNSILVSVNTTDISKQNLVPTLNDRIVYRGKWVAKTWSGFTSLSGSMIWTDGTNIYYSNSNNQYVLNKSTSTWTAKTWNTRPSGNFYGSKIWTDGTNIYYSEYGYHYILDKNTDNWNEKTWNEPSSFQGENIWTDGTNIYCSEYTSQYVLNKSTSTWTEKTWNGLTQFNGKYIWTDGTDIYYKATSGSTYVLDRSTSTWTAISSMGTYVSTGDAVWTDGSNIYGYSGGHYVRFDGAFWQEIKWNIDCSGNNVWSDGDNIYYSGGSDSTQYILQKSSAPSILTTRCKSTFT